MSDLTFIALDFETATSQRASVCEVGLAFVENGEIGISTKDYLFLVASSSATEIVGKFWAVFQELSERKLVRNRQWVCPYKCLKLLISFKDIEHSKWLNKM